MAEGKNDSSKQPASKEPRSTFTHPVVSAQVRLPALAPALASIGKQLSVQVNPSILSPALVSFAEQLSAQVNPPVVAPALAGIGKQLSPHVATSVARMQERLAAQMAPALASIRKQLSAQVNPSILSPALTGFAEQLRSQRVMEQTAFTALREVTAQTAFHNRVVEAFSDVASQSLRLQAQALLPLMQANFPPQTLEAVEETLAGIDDLHESLGETDADLITDDISDETRLEIEEALSAFEAELAVLPASVTRQLWIWWVSLVVLTLSMHALILLPIAKELVTTVMGVGAVEAARQAAVVAGMIWDKRHPQAGETPLDDE